MLSQRIATAVVLAVILLLTLFAASPLPFAALVVIFVAGATYEWVKLSSADTIAILIISTLFFPIVFALSFFNSSTAGLLFFPISQLSGVVSFVTVFFACLAVFFHPRLNSLWSSFFGLLLGLLLLWSAAGGVVFIKHQPNGLFWLVYGFLIVAAADIGAYFTGKAFGKRKLAETISPGKSWEGFWGGFVASQFAGLACLLVFISQNELQLSGQLLNWQVMTGLLSVLSVVGDLFESVLKRHKGVKDSGWFLPGHGGILDRIDGLILVFPALALLLMYSSK